MSERSSRLDSATSDATEYGDHAPFQAARPDPLLTRVIPVSGQLPGYRAPLRAG